MGLAPDIEVVCEPCGHKEESCLRSTGSRGISALDRRGIVVAGLWKPLGMLGEVSCAVKLPLMEIKPWSYHNMLLCVGVPDSSCTVTLRVDSNLPYPTSVLPNMKWVRLTYLTWKL